MSKISILDEQMNHIKPDDAFEDHIKKPEYRRVRGVPYVFYINYLNTGAAKCDQL
jgi:hypothetical protein